VSERFRERTERHEGSVTYPLSKPKPEPTFRPRVVRTPRNWEPGKTSNEMISFQFYSSGIKISVYAPSRGIAESILKYILKPSAVHDFRLEKVEMTLEKYEEAK